MIMTREELNQEKQQEIFSEERHEKRRKITIFVFKLCFFIVVGFLVFYGYTTFVSSKVLSIKEKRIINENLPDNFNGVKVIHFSDLHYGTTIFKKDLKKLVLEINKRSPDLVFFTGDLIDKNYDLSTDEQEQIINLLKKIDCSLGKYAVSGEEDDNEMFFTIMKESNFEVLNNSYELIYNNADEPILLIGLDSLLTDKYDISEAFAYYNEPTHNSNVFSITLLHEPDMIDDILDDYTSNLILAGHSHNGSIVFPFIGGIYRVDGAREYYKEYYQINDSHVYISSGIGTNGPGFRLFCRPSFNFFRISNK